MSAKHILRSTLAAGKIHRVVQDLLACTAADPDLHQQAVALSARFQLYTRSKSAGHLAPGQADLEGNHIIAAALALVEQLPDNKESNSLGQILKRGRMTCSVTIVLAMTLVVMVIGHDRSWQKIFKGPDVVQSDTITATGATGPGKINITTGDNSPAVNAPGGNVIIQYGDDSDWEKAAKKPKSQPDTTRKR